MSLAFSSASFRLGHLRKWNKAKWENGLEKQVKETSCEVIMAALDIKELGLLCI